MRVRCPECRPPALRLAALILPVVLAGCGSEVGRVACTPGREFGGKVAVEGGRPAAFWTDLDVEFEDGAGFVYTFELRDADGASLGTRTCDALDINTRMNSFRKDAGRHHNYRYLGKLKCDPLELEAGATVEVTGMFEKTGDAPAEVHGCDLVLRQ